MRGEPSHVFYAPTVELDTDRLAGAWWAVLDESERVRVVGLERERDRRDYMAAHVMLRIALHRARGSGSAYALPADRSGWSLTHTEGFVACAVAASAKAGIGVDAEPLAAARRLASIAEVYLAPAEALWLNERPADRAANLVELWTAKEAVVKSRGEGITGPRGLAVLSTIECLPGEIANGWNRYDIRDLDEGREGRTVWSTTIGTHVLAVAADAHVGPPALERVDTLLAAGLAA